MKRLLVLLITLGLFFPAITEARKWSDLTVLTTVATGDILAIIDVSATPDIQKQITWGELMAAPGAIGGTTPATSLKTDILGINTTSPAGTLHTVLSAGHPAIFGGDTIATLTAVTVSNADPSVLTKVADTATIDDGLAVGDAVILNSGTNGTVGTYWVASIVVNTSVTLDRQAATGACTDAVVTYVNDPIVIEVGSGSGKPRIVLPLQGNATTPTLAFGDGDTGFYEHSDDNIRVSINGTSQWLFSSTAFRGTQGDGPALLNENVTSTNPTILPEVDNPTTGIGHAADDQLSLIAGAVEGQRIVEANSVIYNLFGVTEQDSVTDGDTDADTSLHSDGDTGDDFTTTCQVGDAVLIWGGSTTADYGIYYITAVVDNDELTLDRATTGNDTDVDFYVLRGGYIMSPDGLVVPSFTRRIIIRANPNLSHPTNNPDDEVIGTYHALGFDDDTDNALITFEVPTDWDGVSDFVLKTYYAFAGNLDDAETYKIDISYRARAINEDLDTGTATTGTFTETIDFAGGENTVGRLFRSNITLSYLDGNNPLTAEDVVGISIDRDYSGDSDTNGEILIIQFEIEYTSISMSKY